MSLFTLVALVIIFALGLFIVRIVLAVVGRSGRRRLPYKSREYLLSRGEYAFYRELMHVTAGEYIVSMKVRLNDVISCPGEAWKEGYQAKISQKHLDFVLCDLESAHILLAIELDDRSHGRADRMKRDEFLDAAMAAAGVPLLRFRAASRYDLKHIADTIDAALQPAVPTARRAG